MIEQINTTLILKSSGLIETNYIGTDQSISSKYLLGNEWCGNETCLRCKIINCNISPHKTVANKLRFKLVNRSAQTHDYEVFLFLARINLMRISANIGYSYDKHIELL